jgi:hypothetical protein
LEIADSGGFDVLETSKSGWFVNSKGDFQEALVALLGLVAPRFSPSVIARLIAGWQAQYDR